ncbi:hypothetical protein PVAP13_9KG156285 [Panicum virgatum]|uniref:Uncharacterized protein n=1 Tax=Panicum virgatum TaxID=38727 RepID=A0A8T0NFX9_PANVG|nr:hypothetical protein PVAP13_9KG156285 [Panicum virgatum]
MSPLSAPLPSPLRPSHRGLRLGAAASSHLPLSRRSGLPLPLSALPPSPLRPPPRRTRRRGQGPTHGTLPLPRSQSTPSLPLPLTAVVALPSCATTCTPPPPSFAAPPGCDPLEGLLRHRSSAATRAPPPLQRRWVATRERTSTPPPQRCPSAGGRGSGYLGQHLLATFASVAGFLDVAFTHHSQAPPQPLLDAYPSVRDFHISTPALAYGFEAISTTFGLVRLIPIE